MSECHIFSIIAISKSGSIYKIKNNYFLVSQLQGFMHLDDEVWCNGKLILLDPLRLSSQFDPHNFRPCATSKQHLNFLCT